MISFTEVLSNLSHHPLRRRILGHLLEKGRLVVLLVGKWVTPRNRPFDRVTRKVVTSIDSSCDFGVTPL